MSSLKIEFEFSIYKKTFVLSITVKIAVVSICTASLLLKHTEFWWQIYL
jgi:hypothetical protein